MKYELKTYQQKAVNDLLELTKTYLKIWWNTKEIIFKAPTGSWKTIMMASFLEELKNEDIWDFAFVWISVNKLHNQSKSSLENVLWVWAFSFYNLENIREKLYKNDVLFINWESITKKAKKANLDKWIEVWDYTNIFMSDNETGRNLPNFIENTLKDNRKIILIIDESQLYLSEETERLIAETIKPSLRIEVSATPKKSPTIEIKLDEVIESGMIKKEVIINEKFDEINLLEFTWDELVIEQALNKRIELKNSYQNNINPLVLIQLSSKNSSDEKTNALDKSEIEKVEKILKEKYNITYENKKLAIWLSENKVNLENIQNFDNEVEVLIFKQAIATGWDCPRAQILVMFRDIKSITFQIQTVGRIMRMPELHHYENDILNKAYIYTNIESITIEQGEASKYFSYWKKASFKNEFKNITLPWSIYLHRVDYNDLEPTWEFHKVFYKTFFEEIWWNENDFIDTLKVKFSQKVKLWIEYTSKIILETKIVWIDEITDYKTWFIKTDEKVIDYVFQKTLEKYLSWLNKARSIWVLKQSFYNFFNHYLWFKDKSALEIQKIVLTNEDFFAYIVKKATEQFKSIQIAHIEKKQTKKEYDFTIPTFEIYPDINEKKDYKKYALTPCCIKEDSKIETQFIQEYLEKNNDIEYWYKNWVKKDCYFGILYNYEWKQSVFYPDFIVKYKNGKIWIFDTKDWNTAGSMETKMKAESLQKYCDKKENIFWWIVIIEKDLFYLNKNPVYNFVNNNLAGWERM